MNFSDTVRITQIRSRQKNIAIVGAVTLGELVEGNVKRLSIRFPNSVIDPKELETGQCWYVVATGAVNTVDGYGFTWREMELNASEAIYTRPSGKHVIRWIVDTVHNIGTVSANRLWDRFGEDLIDLMDAGDAVALSQVINNSETVANLCAEWNSKGDSKSLAFFARYRIPVWVGAKTWQAYGSELIRKITEDPYRLLALWGNFSAVDELAQSNFGINEDDPRRIRSAVEEAAFKLYEDGHTMSCAQTSLKTAERLLGNVKHKYPMDDLLASGVEQGCFVVSTLNSTGERVIHPTGGWLMEKGIYSFLSALKDKESESKSGISKKVIKHIETLEASLLGTEFRLNAEQRQAVEMALNESISVLSGGAGTGKTTVLKAIISGLKMTGYDPVSMALTGMAAARITAATGEPATTIASFIVNNKEGKIPDNIAVVIDESSMLDVFTFYRLIRILPICKMILVGDAGQLPPVGPGLVFHGLIDSAFPLTELKVVKRQSSKSGIPALAASVRSGNVPQISNDTNSDTFLIECSENNLSKEVMRWYDEYRHEAQILCPTNNNPFGGVQTLNRSATLKYTAGMPELLKYNEFTGLFEGSGFCEGDLVVFTKNDWSRDLQNGSLGQIIEVYDPPMKTEKLTIFLMGVAEFNGERIEVLNTDIEKLQHSYALTVHKSQGSQFGTVILPMYKNKFADRTLLYTAITRATNRVIFVGNPDAISKACSFSRQFERRSGLQALLQGDIQRWAA